MSLTVSPISNVTFRAQDAQKASLEDILSRQGAFAKPEPALNAQSKKKHSFLKFLAGTLIAAAVVIGGIYALPKIFTNTFTSKNIDKSLKGMDMVKDYVKVYIAKGSDKIGEFANELTKLPGLKQLKDLF